MDGWMDVHHGFDFSVVPVGEQLIAPNALDPVINVTLSLICDRWSRDGCSNPFRGTALPMSCVLVWPLITNPVVSLLYLEPKKNTSSRAAASITLCRMFLGCSK